MPHALPTTSSRFSTFPDHISRLLHDCGRVGYRELATHRLHLVDMPTHLGLAHVPLDGIGCTFTLVKAHVHREGVMFPTYVFDNQVRPFLPFHHDDVEAY